MKVVVHKENLQRALGFVERLTSKNPTLPILGNILFQTDHGRLKLSATNLEVGVTSVIGAKVEGEGEIAVPGRIFSDLIRSVRGDVITLETSKTTLTIRADSLKTSLLCFNASEYPIIPKIESQNSKTIPSEVFRRMIAGITDSISLSDSRPELAGALLQFQPTTTLLAATDGFRLVEQKTSLKNEESGLVIIPRTTILELARILSGVTGDIQISVTDNQIGFTHEDMQLVSRLIDGKYPDYQKVIPEQCISKVLVRKDELEDAVKVAALFSSNISDIKIDCTSDGVCVAAQNTTKGDAQTTIEGSIKGDPFDVTINYHYFLDGLKTIDTDKVVLEFTSKASPFVLRPHNDKKEGIYLIMPLRG